MRYAIFGAAAISMLALGCRNAPARSHETCVKEAIFAMQRATERITNASDYDGVLAALESLRIETGKLVTLREEFAAFGEPSSWERSRMRQHRSLFASAKEKWAAAMTVMRRRLDDREFPPDVRQKLDDALSEFDAERKRTYEAIEPFWN